MPDARVPHVAYADLDFSHCRKAPQGSVHHFATVGDKGSPERLRARAFGLPAPSVHGSPLAQRSNERKLVAAIESRDLEALREALADPEGIPPTRLKVARELRATLRKEARQQLELRAATPEPPDPDPGSDTQPHLWP